MLLLPHNAALTLKWDVGLSAAAGHVKSVISGQNVSDVNISRNIYIGNNRGQACKVMRYAPSKAFNKKEGRGSRKRRGGSRDKREGGPVLSNVAGKLGEDFGNGLEAARHRHHRAAQHGKPIWKCQPLYRLSSSNPLDICTATRLLT